MKSMIGPKILLLLVCFLVVTFGFSDEYEDDGDLRIPDVYGDSDPYGMGDMSDNPHGGPAAVPLGSLEDIEDYVQEDILNPTIIGFFDEMLKADELNHFQDVAASEGQFYRFGYTTNKTVLELRKYDGCVVVAYPPKKFVHEKERSKFRFPGKSIIVPGLMEFIKLKSLPVVGQLTDQNLRRYETVQRSMLTVFTAVNLDKNMKGFNYFANRLRKLTTEKFAAEVVFNIANVEDFTYIMEMDYGFKNPDPKHTYVGLKYQNYYFAMDEPFSSEAVAKFLKDFSAGTLVGKLKKMQPDEEDDDSDSSVVQLTSNNFQSVVGEHSKNVLIEFYAPWCGHCKQLKPEYRKVAEYFKEDDQVVVAAMDATAHDPPSGFEIEGYPTIIFLRSDDKSKKIPYEGPRDAKGMVDFIKTHRS